MAKRDARLQLVGSTYWVRVKVPEALRRAGLIKKREYRKSLRTRDLSEARRLLPYEIIEIDAEIAAARRRLDLEPIKALTRSEAEYLARAWFCERDLARSGRKLVYDENWKIHDEIADREDAEARYADPDPQDQAGIRDTTRRLIERHGIAVDFETPEFRHLAELVRRGGLELARRGLRQARSDFTLREGDAFFADARADAQIRVTSVNCVTLRELIAQQRAEPSWQRMAPKSKFKGTAQARLFEEVFGADRDVSQIARSDAAKLVSLLIRLPSNASKLFPGLTAPQAADAAALKDTAPISRLTASSYLGAFSSLMEFAVSRGIRSDNPAKGLSVGTDGVSAKDRRYPFSATQLTRIFTAPLYTGCLNDKAGYARAGNRVFRRGRFWIPLIALFTGMRLNEICQLLVSDIALLDGVDVFIVASDDAGEKRVKTTAGERFVPIHPELKLCGFLEYRNLVAIRGDKRLFPELTVAKSSGYPSDNFGKWFANFLKSIDADQKRTSFHSFRHNYRDALREADISAERVRALGGWSSGRTEDDYGSGLRASTLAREIEKVGYEGLDLSHLHHA